MRILALDLGTKTGWALSVDGQIISGMWDLHGGRFDGGGMRFVRFEQLVRTLEPRKVYYEEVRRHLGTDAAHVYGGFQATLMRWCESQEPRVPYGSVPVGTIKKHATGKGNANKEQMVAAARAKWPEYQIIDDNEADALWLLDYVMQEAP